MPRGQDTIRTVSFVSLGCPKNLVDSEKMLGLLAQEGLVPLSLSAGPEPERWDDARHVEGETSAGGAPARSAAASAAPAADDFGGADVVVINTCGFLEASKDESLSVIKEAIAAKQAGHVKRVVVAGCLVQRHRAKMLEWAPGIDAMVGVFDRDKIIEAVRGGAALPRDARPSSAADASDRPAYWIAGNALEAAQTRGMNTVGLTVQGKDGKGIGYFEDDSARLRLTPRHYAYLRVSEGCNQRCAFCTIPSIRGKMRSKPLDRIVAEARELAADGAFELNLIGQDTTSYGEDIGLGLAQQAGADPFRGGLPRMLKEICTAVREVSSSGWVRLMYAYPSNFSDEMIDAFASLCAQGVLLPYIDMPLQHASDRMLTAMRRNVTADHQRRLIETLRERVPGLALRTTFISGFPGETEADHQELLRFVSDMQFDAVGVFEYSPEPGTPAGTMEDDPALAVPAADKRRRKDEVMGLQQEIAFDQAAYLAEQFDTANPLDSGCRFNVLIDRPLASEGVETSGVGRGGRLYQGRSPFQAPQIDAVTYVQSREKLAPGELVPCVIVDSDGYDLIARPVNDLERRVGLKIM